jgi:hypothetical protein
MLDSQWESSGGSHSWDLGFVPSLDQLVIVGLIIWDRVGPLSGKWRIVGWEGRGVWCGKPAPPRLQPPPVSVKYRWVGPREQVLNVPIAHWWYEPSKTSSLPLTDAWLKPTASVIVLKEKLRRVSWTTQLGWEVESGALFLESSSIRLTLLTTHERLIYADHVRYVWSRVIRGLIVEFV